MCCGFCVQPKFINANNVVKSLYVCWKMLASRLSDSSKLTQELVIQVIAICASNNCEYITEGNKKPNTLKRKKNKHKTIKHYFPAHQNRQRLFSRRIHMTGMLRNISFSKLLQKNQDVLPAFYI